jgi:hypothetical protein
MCKGGMSMAESQIERIMRGLKCTEAEAIEIARADKEIDKGAKMPFDLSAEAKKYAKTGTRTTNGGKVERKRKENPTKGAIIAEIAQFLAENGYESVEITNKERQIALKVGEIAFELTLVQKRAKK